MNKTSSVRDPYPRFRAAGISTLRNGEEINPNATDFGQSLREDPSTPEHMKKYRKSYKTQAGTKILHHGVYDDVKPPEKFMYGKPTLVSDHVVNVFENPNEGIKQYLNEIKESKYASNIREPLAKTYSRNYSLPGEIINNPNFKYGVAVVQSEASKNVIFPLNEEINEPEDVKKQYLKSHQTYDAGEQRDRGYNWKVDPKNHRFGKENPQITKEMNQVLQPEFSQDSFPKTTIVKKNQEDFRNFKEDPLGKPKNLGQINQYIDDNFIFGKKNNAREWNVAKCVQGEATFKEVGADSNLGKSCRHGFRNIVKEGDESRMFGVPTIRTDIKSKAFKSVADPNNYGDEPPALHLLFPKKYAELGLSEEDFRLARTKEEIKSIFLSIGINYKIGKFEGVYKRALDYHNESGKTSVEAFLVAVDELHEVD